MLDQTAADDLALAGALPPQSVYRSLAGRQAVLDLCDRAIERLPFPHRNQILSTGFGYTHVTIGGKAGAKPLVVLPGMSIPGPFMLEFFARMGQHRLMIAPDMIGHPGRSEDRVHSPRDHGFGRWLGEVMDGMKLDSADMLTGSFGASAALDLCAIAPERVGRMALVVPAGLTPRIPMHDISWRFILPWMVYRYFPDRRRLAKIAEPLARALGPNEMDFLDVVIRQTAFWRHWPAGPFLPGSLSGYRTPVLFVTAGRDHLFPHVPTRANAQATLEIAEEIHLPDSAHMPGPASMLEILERIVAYLGH